MRDRILRYPLADRVWIKPACMAVMGLLHQGLKGPISKFDGALDRASDNMLEFSSERSVRACSACRSV